MAHHGPGSMRRTLTTADTFAVATGAMFSSGFFLLPGLAAKLTGTSVVLAYLVAGLLMVPAMWSKAELATAMPRAGGTYFFVDRAFGSTVGLSAGFSTWAALVLKTAFALLGLAATIALWVDVPLAPVGVACAVVFVAVNLWGTSHSASLQRWLVGVLLAALAAFLVAAATTVSGVTGQAPTVATAWETQPFLADGWGGFAATVGLVSVSYAGLTKVASVAEEVRSPDTAIPHGMFLSLGITTAVYVLGVTAVLMLLPASTLHGALAPVAEAARVAFTGSWGAWGAGLVILAALAAFVSTANAGIMAAARYPFAMARDGALPASVGLTSASGVPRTAVALTGALVVAAVCVDVTYVAKLASSVQLVLFGLVCASVIVLRESDLDGYQPGFRSPLYPWVQIAGIAVSVFLVAAMGWASLAFAAVMLVGSVVLHRLFVREAVRRPGALAHVFRRLGDRASEGVEHELAGILAERALDDEGTHTDFVAHVVLGEGSPLDRMIDHPLHHRRAPEGVFVALVDRHQEPFVPEADTVVRRGDRLTLVGQPDVLDRALDPRPEEDSAREAVAWSEALVEPG